MPGPSGGTRPSTFTVAAVALVLVYGWILASYLSMSQRRPQVVEPEVPVSHVDAQLVEVAIAQAQQQQAAPTRPEGQLPHEIPVEDGGVPPPPFPRPRLTIFAPLNWPRDQYKVRAIDATWGSHTDRVFYSTSWDACEKMHTDDFHPQKTKDRFLCLNMTHHDNYEQGIKRNIWEKSWRSWVYMLENHLEDSEFFMKCDSDSWVAVENMKTYLSYFDPEEDWYLGHTLMHEWGQDILFNTGIGYVISRGAARRLIKVLKEMTTECDHFRACCQMPGPNEDAHMGACMRDIGVVPTNTLDDEGRLRFYAFRPEDHVSMYKENTWYWRYKPKDVKDGPECCNEFPVVMHNYKEHDNMGVFLDLTRRFHTGPALNGGQRITSVPDHGPFRFDETQVNFKFGTQRQLCSKHPGSDGC